MNANLLLPVAFAAGLLSAQNQPVLGEDAVKVSEHVWTIFGFPNVAIIVGNRATLVVDTGLGPRNGATIARVAAKLAPGNQKLFLTTTHFHPEHAAGDAGFPPGTILIRDAVQQREMELHGKEMVDMFAGRSALQKELLANATLRTPDITFDTEAKIDLGDVAARLLWFGGAHTKGDELHVCRTGSNAGLRRRCAEQGCAQHFRRRRYAFQLAEGPGQSGRAERPARAAGSQRSGRWLHGCGGEEFHQRSAHPRSGAQEAGRLG